MARAGQARTQLPQARQEEGSGKGTVYGVSCVSNRDGQAAAAAHTPSAQTCGRHLVKSSIAIFLNILLPGRLFS
jgi:hypothetical protein